MKAIIGRKVGMTQVFAADGSQYAVSVIEVLPNVVSQVKTLEKDGYEAVQIGYEVKKESRANKAEKGRVAKSGLAVAKHYVELKGDELKTLNVGDTIDASIFAAGDVVDVIGTSKGKGFTGVIKRYGHKIGPKAHGSGYHRGIGSFANNGRCNNRVLPGKKMPGHHGHQRSTILNLLVVEANAAENYILVRGGIPGPKKGLIQIRSAVKVQRKTKEVVKELVNTAPVVEQVEVKGE